jgi:hypothetical protein
MSISYVPLVGIELNGYHACGLEGSRSDQILAKLNIVILAKSNTDHLLPRAPVDPVNPQSAPSDPSSREPSHISRPFPVVLVLAQGRSFFDLCNSTSVEQQSKELGTN